VCLALSSIPNRALAQLDGTPLPQAPSQPREDSSSGFVMAGGVGYGFARGRFYAPPSNGSASPLLTWFDTDVRETVSGQLPFFFGVAYRPIPLLSFGATTELGQAFLAHCSSQCSSATFYLGGDLRFHFRTDRGLSPWVSLGLGYELLHFETGGGSASLSGYAVDLQAGGDFRTSSRWTVGPYLGLRIGTYRHTDFYAFWRGASPQSVDISYEDQAVHEWVTIGVRGTFTVSLR
jgi:hypothetical protein